MDSQGTEIFDYLLPKKEAEFRERLNNLLVGFIIVTNSDDVITSSQKHFPCDQVEKKMNELKGADQFNFRMQSVHMNYPRRFFNHMKMFTTFLDQPVQFWESLETLEG